MAVTERQATPTQVFSYGIVYLHFYEIKKWHENFFNLFSQAETFFFAVKVVDENLIIVVTFSVYIAINECFKLLIRPYGEVYIIRTHKMLGLREVNSL